MTYDVRRPLGAHLGRPGLRSASVSGLCVRLGASILMDAGAVAIVSGDDDLLCLHPWRGIAIVRPSAFPVPGQS